jgi:hypothetical protein
MLGTELAAGSAFLSELTKYGRNPQSSEGFTEWMTIGSQCDYAVQPTSSSAGMDASHALVYSGSPYNPPTCYDHGGALHDLKTEHDAKYYYCDTSDPDANPCGSKYQSSRWSKTTMGLHGLELLYTEITKGLLNSAIRTHPRLWMAATLASAWALLAKHGL